jgi:hypothetical protein
MNGQSYSFFRGSDYLRIEAISHFCSIRKPSDIYTTTHTDSELTPWCCAEGAEDSGLAKDVVGWGMMVLL